MTNSIANGNHQHDTVTGIDSTKVGFWTFLSSECVFFAILLVGHLTYQHNFLEGPTSEDLFNITLTTVSTFVLLMSSLAMALAVNASHHDDAGTARRWVLVTALMGLLFLGFQVYEFSHFMSEGLMLGTSPFATSFYVLTGFHGVHVAIGVLWLLSVWFYGAKNKLGAKNALGVELAGLYWHFVDIVWIVLFTAVYLLPTVV
jgi:heme/copper-type cytochrome/quinol oxidase subunit 3